MNTCQVYTRKNRIKYRTLSHLGRSTHNTSAPHTCSPTTSPLSRCTCRNRAAIEQAHKSVNARACLLIFPLIFFFSSATMRSNHSNSSFNVISFGSFCLGSTPASSSPYPLEGVAPVLSTGAVGTVDGSVGSTEGVVVGSTAALVIGVAVAVVEVFKPEPVDLHGFLLLLPGW